MSITLSAISLSCMYHLLRGLLRLLLLRRRALEWSLISCRTSSTFWRLSLLLLLPLDWLRSSPITWSPSCSIIGSHNSSSLDVVSFSSSTGLNTLGMGRRSLTWRGTPSTLTDWELISLITVPVFHLSTHLGSRKHNVSFFISFMLESVWHQRNLIDASHPYFVQV